MLALLRRPSSHHRLRLYVWRHTSHDRVGPKARSVLVVGERDLVREARERVPLENISLIPDLRNLGDVHCVRSTQDSILRDLCEHDGHLPMR